MSVSGSRFHRSRNAVTPRRRPCRSVLCHSAVRELAPALDGFTVIVTKSTVSVGTSDEVARIIRDARPDADFAVASTPEFLREGAAIQDFKHPDRIVVGSEDERARKIMAEIYRPLYLNRTPILYSSRRSAELIKYGANTFPATKVAFLWPFSLTRAVRTLPGAQGQR